MKKVILASILTAILSGCGGSSGGTTGSPSGIDNTGLADGIETVGNNLVITNTSKTFNNGEEIQGHIQYINMIPSSKIPLTIYGGHFLEGITNQNGTVKLYGGTIDKDFVNEGGAVHIKGENDVHVEGAFKSIGKAILTPHQNPTNGVRIVVGPKTLYTGSVVFDEYTEINIALTDAIVKVPTVIESKGDVDFGSKTIFNFEKCNKSKISVGSKFTLLKAKSFNLSEADIRDNKNARYVIEYRTSSHTGADNDSVEFLKENDGSFEYLVVRIKKEISPISSSGSSRTSFLSKAQCFANHVHSHKNHFSFLQNNGAFDMNARVSNLGNGLSFVTLSKEGDSGAQFVGFNQKNHSNSFGMYANFASNKDLKDAGAYSSFSCEGLNFTNSFALSSHSDNEIQAKSLNFSSHISAPFQLGVLTVAPKVGFGYGEILQAKHDLYEASLDSKNAFEGTLGLDVSTKIQGFELFSSLEYAAQLGSTMVTIEDERHHVSYSKTSLTFGIKGDVDQNSKMYGSFNFAPETASASFAVGMNIKF